MGWFSGLRKMKETSLVVTVVKGVSNEVNSFVYIGKYCVIYIGELWYQTKRTFYVYIDELCITTLFMSFL